MLRSYVSDVVFSLYFSEGDVTVSIDIRFVIEFIQKVWIIILLLVGRDYYSVYVYEKNM